MCSFALRKSSPGYKTPLRAQFTSSFPDAAHISLPWRAWPPNLHHISFMMLCVLKIFTPLRPGTAAIAGSAESLKREGWHHRTRWPQSRPESMPSAGSAVEAQSGRRRHPFQPRQDRGRIQKKRRCGWSRTGTSGSEGRAAGPSGGSLQRTREETGRAKPGGPEECGRSLLSQVSYARQSSLQVCQLTAGGRALAQEADHGLAALLEDLGGIHCDGVRERAWSRGTVGSDT